jgi:hypothetical protein
MVGRQIEDSISGRGKTFSLFHSTQTAAGTHYSMGNRNSFPGGNVVGA